MPIKRKKTKVKFGIAESCIKSNHTFKFWTEKNDIGEDIVHAHCLVCGKTRIRSTKKVNRFELMDLE
jgi:hypothetical protein